MSKSFLNPLSIFNILSGHLHRGNIHGAVEGIKDLPWKETENNGVIAHYELQEIDGKRSILGQDSDTLIFNLEGFSFFIRETPDEKVLKVSSASGYKMEKKYE